MKCDKCGRENSNTQMCKVRYGYSVIEINLLCTECRFRLRNSNFIVEEFVKKLDGHSGSSAEQAVQEINASAVYDSKFARGVIAK